MGRYEDARDAYTEGLKYDADSEVLKQGVTDCNDKLSQGA